MLFVIVPILQSLRTCTSCASLLQFLSTWIICTQYSLCSSTSCDNNFYSTSTASMQPPQSSTPTALNMPLYSTCLRDVYGRPFCATSIDFSGPSLTYNGGNECTATLHSSDRDPTLRLHLHFANLFMITSAEMTMQWTPISLFFF